MTISPDDEDLPETAADEVPLDVPEDDAAEQRQTLSEPSGEQGVDADERVVELDEDEYR
jgi:hypothetical protein